MDQEKKLMPQEDKNDWANLSPEEIAGIEAGLADIDDGRTFSHIEVMARIEKKLDNFRNSKSR